MTESGKHGAMMPAIAGAVYFVLVFALGFALRAFRVGALEPRLGEFASVLLELPVIIAASWFVCGFVIQRFQVAPARNSRMIMGAIAFSLLIGAELALGILAFGRSPRDQIADWLGPAGVIGLAGQILFGLFPLFRRDG